MSGSSGEVLPATGMPRRAVRLLPIIIPTKAQGSGDAKPIEHGAHGGKDHSIARLHQAGEPTGQHSLELRFLPRLKPRRDDGPLDASLLLSRHRR
jgi:hypothetical protein